MPEHSNAQFPAHQRAALHQRALLSLGRRLRARREAAGLSLSDVAGRSGVSRRHLTEAEAGRANLSVLRLLDLARALDVPVETLVRETEGPRDRIALVGLRGAGKSTLGLRLALRLEVPFVELDQRVEALAGLRLGEIFGLHGEEGFHRFEAEALEDVLREGERVVLAVGGSVVARPTTFERLRRTCRTVWLRASPAEHFERVQAQGDRRPMADRPRARAELEALLRVREPLYAACDDVVDTRGLDLDAAFEALTTAIGADRAS